MKVVQGAVEVIPEGLVLVVANYPLGSKDATGAIQRRLRMFPVNQVIPENKKDRNLVCITSDGFEAKLIEVLPGLLNWVLEVDCSHAI